MQVRSHAQYLLEQDLEILLNSLNESAFHDWLNRAKSLISRAKSPTDAGFLLGELYKKLKSASSLIKQVTLKHMLPLLIGTTILSSSMIDTAARQSGDADLQTITREILQDKVPAADSSTAPDWAAYAQDADAYLKFFPGTPMNGRMLAHAAKTTFDRTGTLVPIDLVLAQGQSESQLGTDPHHRNPKKNPFSVGEDDDKTRFRPKSIQHGVQAYYDLMARKYLAGKSAEQLLTKFVDTTGQRYASDKQYEHKLQKRVRHIRDYLNRTHKQQQTQASYATI